MSDALDDWIKTIVLNNRDKNFVDRISNPGAYPTLKLADGNVATHKMAWGTTNGRPLAYPLVVYDKATKKLRELPPKDAFQYAIQNKEYLEFPDERSADIFSREYKRLWSSK